MTKTRMMKQVVVSLFVLAVTFGSICSAIDLPENYESKTAGEKMDIIFDLVKAGEGTKGKYPSFFTLARSMFFDDFSPTVDHMSDFIPYDHDKRIHSVGGVATMEFVSPYDHSYTGLFKGTPYAAVRLSSARPYSHSAGPIPGLGVKFFIDGKPSVNFVAMNSLDGQDSGNFFERDFSSHVGASDAFSKKLLAWSFEKASKPANMVGLSEIASYTNDGSEETNPNFPFEIILVPNKELRMKHSDMKKTNEELQRVLESIPIGTKIYEVYGRASPTADREPIGEMVITSQMVYSEFGDRDLFFRHQRMEDDFELRPEWRSALPSRRSLRERCPLGFDEDDESMQEE